MEISQWRDVMHKCSCNSSFFFFNPSISPSSPIHPTPLFSLLLFSPLLHLDPLPQKIHRYSLSFFTSVHSSGYSVMKKGGVHSHCEKYVNAWSDMKYRTCMTANYWEHSLKFILLSPTITVSNVKKQKTSVGLFLPSSQRPCVFGTLGFGVLQPLFRKDQAHTSHFCSSLL